MSGTVNLTVGGSFNGHNSVVTVPSSLLFGALSTTGSINALLQSYLGGLSSGFGTSTDFTNVDLATGTTYLTPASVPGASSVEEFTNTDNTSATAPGSGPYTASVSGAITDLIVQAPGVTSLTGSSATSVALFGAGSSVDYTVTNPTAGTMYLAGGANSVTLFSTNTTNAETIYSAGNDTINLVGQGTDYVTVTGNGTIQDFAANAYVTAEGNATTNLYWDNANAGGTLHFTNNSSVAATIHIGNFNGLTSTTKVTASGGAGGGFFVGGTAGSNSLVGGTGVVTLVGAGSGDFLEANSSGQNVLAQGAGPETMIASSTTGSNIFGAGLQYPGLGNPAATGLISTDGSGVQEYLLGNVPGGETIYGSSVASSSNNYFIVSGTVDGGTVGGGLYSIYNFINSSSTIFLSNGSGGPGSATIQAQGVDQFNSSQYDILLSDGTQIQLKGLTTSQIAGIHTSQLDFGVGDTVTAITG